MAVAVSRGFGWWAVLLVVPGIATRRVWVVGMLVAGLVSGISSVGREQATIGAELPSGRVTVAGRLVDDPRPYGFDLRARLDPTHLRTRVGWDEWSGPRLVVVLDDPVAAVAGERVTVTGRLRHRPGFVRGDPFAGVVEAVLWSDLDLPPTRCSGPATPSGAGSPRSSTGKGPKERCWRAFSSVMSTGSPRDGSKTCGWPACPTSWPSAAAMSPCFWRSGSSPPARSDGGPRRRAFVGFVGLALFLVVTRWEPSVVRASMMAGLVLLGRLGGVALTPWVALGAAVTTSLLVAGQLSGDAGFQLSVVATAGVVAGSRWVRGVGWGPAGQALAITLGAQLAVAPLLLVHFGTVPLLSPLTNLVAAPVVTLATAAGGVAVLTGSATATAIATWLAGIVLTISHLAAGWPQLGAAGLAGVAAVAGAARLRPLRPLVALGAALVVAAGLLPAGRVVVPTLVFLDVGQGDATLLLGPEGETILVDGGPDPSRLLAKLRGRGIDHIDLMVATHGDKDHIAGLGAVLTAYPVGRLWHPGHTEGSELYAALLVEAAAAGVAAGEPRTGWAAEIGSFRLEVLSPRRRFSDINNESVVLRVTVGATVALLTGDVEATAQAELGPVTVDILKVPHHGAATTDLRWLAASTAPVAVISVGPNDFGHPHPEVMAVLEESGSEIRRTDLEGDVVIPLGP